ncbi:GNAT family N-acetyltransferase [Actinoplanes couchii]|uniref:GNAT family N-acetyltransferase n=2 Tax=Actinoplanes couchii TaxID=403638 RepID=UPI0028594464|nr:GNAT family N-acetyltransferase [Actinoplanes couchii]MDR6321851.1 putative acetyltransferase [Actinoplanes couchii]
MPWTAATPPRPPSRPVELRPMTRSDRAVLGNLGQLYRHDLSEFYGVMPNDDGSFNNRPVDLFFAEAVPETRAWLITAAGSTAGFVMTTPDPAGGLAIASFFVVRALRRTGVGFEAATRVIAMFPGRWTIGFQRYNPGVERFWSRVATEMAGDRWEIHDGPVPDSRPPDTFITFTTPVSGIIPA